MADFIEIPSFIKSELDELDLPKQKISRTIFQTYNTNKIHPELYNNIMEIRKKNPDYDYRIITDNEGIFLIKTYFNIQVLHAFQKLTLGAAKGDFIRYIALYLYGGVYLDLDASIDLSLITFIDPEDEFVFFINGDANLEQFCFMVRPKHPILLKVIQEMVAIIENK